MSTHVPFANPDTEHSSPAIAKRCKVCHPPKTYNLTSRGSDDLDALQASFEQNMANLELLVCFPALPHSPRRKA